MDQVALKPIFCWLPLLIFPLSLSESPPKVSCGTVAADREVLALASV
jgi:hypothetical protein